MATSSDFGDTGVVTGVTDSMREHRWRRALGLGAAAAVLGTSACAGGDGVPTLMWYINPDDGGQATLAERCTEEAAGAYRIQVSLLPRDADGQREQLIRRLASQDASIDMMSLDPVYVPEMANAGYLVPVPDEYVEEFTANAVESSVASSTWEDELIAAPFWANTQLLWYRESVAEAAGLDMDEPVTWDQLIEAAASQDKELGVQGIRAEALTVWINALIESAGGHIVENPEASADEVQLGIDSPAGQKAAEIMSTIGQEGLGGPSFSNQDENGAMLRFQGDTGSFMVNWPFVYAATAASVDGGSLDQEVLDDMAWTFYPATEEGTESRPPLGGINIGVSSYSAHPDEAFQAIECIRSTDNQAEYMVTNGNPASDTRAYEDPEVQEQYPMADIIRESLERAAPRPMTPYYNEVTGGLQRSWHPPAGLDPQTTPAASADLIEQILRGEALL
ncbi:extracellular solute-binding protein [Sediminivirga luteola]|nr:extracellular solute-binding protein [Sediminivirga luteola]MCI2266423.1 extracellular solute-binding protein [Sediminivirga luteola]